MNGVGAFYADGTLGEADAHSFHLEAYRREVGALGAGLSFDEGKTWETNWIMEFKRAL